MKYKINYSIVLSPFDIEECYFIVEGDTLEEIQEKVKDEINKRGFDDSYDVWSELINEKQ